MNKSLSMTLLNNHLDVTIALVTRAQPSPTHWNGQAAIACRDELEKLLHQLRSLKFEMALLGLIPA
jgi:hypothetical protein